MSSMGFTNGLSISLPQYQYEHGNLPALSFDITAAKTAEERLIETKMVNPVTYVELEFVLNEAYRELKQVVGNVGYHILKTEDALEKAKAHVILDKYPSFIENKPKSVDNADYRKAFIALDPSVQEIKDRLDVLKTLESLLESRIKVLEKASSYMKKRMDLIIKSGLSHADLYVTSGKK